MTTPPGDGTRPGWSHDLLRGAAHYYLSGLVVGLGLLLGLSFFRAPDGPGPVKTDSWAS